MLIKILKENTPAQNKTNVQKQPPFVFKLACLVFCKRMSNIFYKVFQIQGAISTEKCVYAQP